MFICAFMATIAPIVTTLSLVFNLTLKCVLISCFVFCTEIIKNITDSVYFNTCKDLEMCLFTVQEQSAQPDTTTEF